jgi:Arc/MetJ-type ribon-helix-helix transcriptional regulator
MSKKVTVELPDALYQAVDQMASAAGVTPSEIIAAQVAQQVATRDTDGNSHGSPTAEPVHPNIQKLLQQVATQKAITFDQALFQWKTKYGNKVRKALSDEERKAWHDQLRRHAGAVDSGDLHSADNDRIDAALTAEYENPHR